MDRDLPQERTGALGRSGDRCTVTTLGDPAIQRRLVGRLARGQKAKGPFVPRLTIGRFSAATAIEFQERVPEELRFTVRTISMLESFVKASGTEHSQLASFDLV